MTIKLLNSTQRFDELMTESTNTMSSIYFGEISKDTYHTTMFSSSKYDRFLNNLIGYDIKRIFKKTGHTLDEMISGHGQKDNTTENIEQIKKSYQKDKSLIHKLAKVASKIQMRRKPVMNMGEKILKFKDKVSGHSKEYLEGVEKYKIEYGEEFFSHSAISRAGSNVMAMRLFADGNDLPSPPKKAMYAIALLHPLTDDYMDQGLIDSKIVQGISKKLEDENVVTSNTYEKLVYDLIDDIFEDYPKDKHPILSHILESLHKEQIRSLDQKGDISMEDIVGISLRKGGLSTLAAGYIALGGLSERQFKFFYELGALFQFIDDSADTTEDLNDGVNTIWTSPISKNEKCDDALYRTLELHRYIRNQAMDDYAKDFTYPNFATTLYDKGFRLLMLRGFFVNENKFGIGTQKLIKNTLPARYDEIKSLILYLHPRINGDLPQSSEKSEINIPTLLY